MKQAPFFVHSHAHARPFPSRLGLLRSPNRYFRLLTSTSHNLLLPLGRYLVDLDPAVGAADGTVISLNLDGEDAQAILLPSQPPPLLSSTIPY